MKRMMAACLAVLAMAGAARGGDDPLEGLWVAHVDFDTGPSGTLTLTRHGTSWHAVVGSEHTAFSAAGDALAFALPDHRGGFRGTLQGSRISGFWIQPDVKPHGANDTRYATPVELVAHGRNAWRGAVAPLPGHFTLFLKLFRGEDGALTAAFRNPEVNSRGGANQFHVARDGDVLTFTADSASALKAVVERDRIAMTWPGLGRALTLARATQAEAAHFSPSPAVYTYREPEPAQDGWRVARAGDTGMDEDKLAALVQEIASSDPASKRPVLIHSLLIARHGRLILDEYFHGYDRAQPHDLRSAGKTFTSVLLGALMHDGVSIGPDARIADYLAPSANLDPRKSAITLAQLMTHTSGLACDDNDDASPGNEETMQSQQAQPDWRTYIIDLPMAHDPGTRYAYCSGGINLAGAALAAASHTAMPELFDREIARKLQWGPYYWNLMPDGEGYLGGGAYVRPRDLLKLGQAYLDGGVWNGARIADASWVAQSTASRVVINPQTTGLTPDKFSNVYIPGEDGYAWHLKTFAVAGHSYAAYGAGGNGGQLLIVIPALDMVIAFTGGNYGQGGIWSKWRDEIVPNEIIPAVKP